MSEQRAMVKEIRALSLLLALICSLLALALFFEAWKAVLAGIWIGVCTGLMGFGMIVAMSERLTPDVDGRRIGMSSYARRFLLYTLIFVLAVHSGVSVFALLAGMLCHKGSILLYTFIHRKGG